MITPSQTIGPFFGFGLPYDDGPELVRPWRPDAITVSGRVLDGAGMPLPDALLEIWQAAPDGSVPAGGGPLLRIADEFSGFGRCPTDRGGRYRFTTLKPGARDGAPHLALLLFARGLLKPVRSRIYFPEDDHSGDPVLTGIAPARRGTLIAAAAGERAYRFDVRLRGDDETVFFAL